MVPVQIKDSEVPGSLVSLGEQWLRAGICFALTMGNLPSKLCSRYRVGIICHSQEPMTLAVKTFLPCLPCTLAPSVNLQTYLLLRSLGGAFAAFAHIFISLEPGPLVGKNGPKKSPSEAHGSESRKYSKGVGERGPIPHYRHYNSLIVCSRFLAPFAQNGEPVHRLTFSTPTVHYGISHYHCIIYSASISLTVLGALQCTKTLKNLYI